MTFDLQKILESKRAYRQRLAARPIAEKLAMLDALRECHLAIRGSANRSSAETGILREAPATYRTKPK